jgi:23S rRNA (cytosine1962-C5)-methyltransferase
MRHDKHLTIEPWADYELLDSGEHMKLERFGEVVVARPETQAVWAKGQPELWQSAQATFVSREGKGAWQVKTPVPESWPLAWGNVRFTAKLTSFKHTGVFPEQAPNWTWLRNRVQELKPGAQVLNLFGYTGVASLVAAAAGAQVTHVDASKQSLDWAHDNARLSEIPEDKIRWMLDDALAFVKREVRRGSKYDGIILDPPAFGRGAKGEIWRIEEDLLPLLRELKELLSDTPGSFFVLNGYAAGYAARSFAQAVESVFGNVDGEAGELYIAEKDSGRVIPAGVSVRFVR